MRTMTIVNLSLPVSTILGNLALRIPIDSAGKTKDILDRLGLPDPVPVLANIPIPKASYFGSQFRKEDRFKRLPKYLVTNSLFEDYIRDVIDSKAFLSTGVELQIIDFSNSYRGSPPTPLPTTYARVRAPEVFASKLSPAVIKCGGVQGDFWSTACTIFEIACPGSILFASYSGPKAMLDEVIQKVGPLPESWQLTTNSWPPTSPVSVDQHWEECLSQCDAFQQDVDAARGCLLLVRQMLQVDPESRPSAELLCSDQWLKDGDMGTSEDGL